METENEDQPKSSITKVLEWIRQHPFDFIGILLLIALVSLIVYWAIWADISPYWTGFGAYNEDASGPRAKTLWEWMELLIIPIILAIAGYWYSDTQKQAELEIADKTRKEDQKLASDKQHQTTFENYLDQMTKLLLDRKLRNSSEDDEVRSIARAQTLMVLRDLDLKRIDMVFDFIEASNLKRIISLSEGYLEEVKWENANLSGANLSGAKLRKANLSSANLINANLSKAQMQDVNLAKANLTGADLSGVDLNGYGKIFDHDNLYLSGTVLNFVDLRRANLVEANLREIDFVEVDLSEANLNQAVLVRANMPYAILHSANLYQADLQNANLVGAEFDDANLREVKLQNADLGKAILRKADLTGAHLSEAKLLEADLQEAILTEANLSGADLRKVNLAKGSLSKADLTGANLSNADLSGAILHYTHNLARAELRGARYNENTIWPFNFDFQHSGAFGPGADLTGADLSEANLIGAILKGARYDSHTTWPDNFDPQKAGAILEE